MNINFIIHEPADEYHARSRSGEFMSSHLLADFRESPALYRKKVQGQIQENESAAFTIGRAAHCLILEGRNAFDKEYVVSDGPINPRTGESYGSKTKAFAEWAATQEREVVSGKDFNFILKLQTGVWLHPVASELLATGVAEGVIRTEYCGVPCQIRMDCSRPNLAWSISKPATVSAGLNPTAAVTDTSTSWRFTGRSSARLSAWTSRFISSPWKRTSRSPPACGS